MTGKMVINDRGVRGLAGDGFFGGGEGVAVSGFSQLLLFVDWVCVSVLLGRVRTEKRLAGKSIRTAISYALKNSCGLMVGRLEVSVFFLLLFFLVGPFCILFLSLVTARNKKLVVV